MTFREGDDTNKLVGFGLEEDDAPVTADVATDVEVDNSDPETNLTPEQKETVDRNMARFRDYADELRTGFTDILGGNKVTEERSKILMRAYNEFARDFYHKVKSLPEYQSYLSELSSTVDEIRALYIQLPPEVRTILVETPSTLTEEKSDESIDKIDSTIGDAQQISSQNYEAVEDDYKLPTQTRLVALLSGTVRPTPGEAAFISDTTYGKIDLNDLWEHRKDSGIRFDEADYYDAVKEADAEATAAEKAERDASVSHQEEEVPSEQVVEQEAPKESPEEISVEAASNKKREVDAETNEKMNTIFSEARRAYLKEMINAALQSSVHPQSGEFNTDEAGASAKVEGFLSNLRKQAIEKYQTSEISLEDLDTWILEQCEEAKDTAKKFGSPINIPPKNIKYSEK